MHTLSHTETHSQIQVHMLAHKHMRKYVYAEYTRTYIQAHTNRLTTLTTFSFPQVMASPSALCHYLDDNSCSALIILGFIMMSPLVVVAAATFCGLLRRLRLLWLFQPISGAWFRGRSLGWSGDLRAWV